MATTSRLQTVEPEILGGIAYKPDMNKFKNQRILSRLIRWMGDYVEDNEMGELVFESDIQFSKKDKPRPDLVFVAKEKISQIVDYINVIPDLVIEGVSDSSLAQDTEKKKAIYEHYGVTEYWVVLPALRQITVYGLVNGQYEIIGMAAEKGVIHSNVVKGFSVDVAKLFANLN